jgi:putative peptide zinc metalloprotease protein
MNQPLESRSRARRIALLIVFIVLSAMLLGLPAANTWQPPLPRVAAQDGGDVEITTQLNGGGGKNVVQVNNQKDGKRRMRASIQLNRIPGPSVAPANLALAQASCTGCQTIAIALQIDLISTSAGHVTPQNAAVAVNYACSGCVTIAVALQYVISVDDPTQVPPEVNDLINEMERELRAIAKDKNASVRDVVSRIDAVLTQFRSLAESLNDQRDEATESTSPDATPENFASPEMSSPVASPVASPVGTEAATGTNVGSDGGEVGEAAATQPPDQTAPASTPQTPTAESALGTPET